MSFWTEFKFYHPGPFPLVTCAELGRLCRAIRDAGISPEVAPVCHVKFGSMTQDHESLDRCQDACEIHFGANDRAAEADILTELNRHATRPVYRAHLSMGNLSRDARRRLHVPDPRNDVTVAPYAVDFSINLVSLCDLDSDEIFVPSLMALGVSGPGYCYPREPREVLSALRAEPEILALERTVEAIWPIHSVPPGSDELEERRAMGHLWLHDLDRPRGWAWGFISS